MKAKFTSLKTQATAGHKESRACETTELLPIRKPVLVRLMRMLCAATLVLPAFGATAGVVFTTLYSFSGLVVVETNGVGSTPDGGLVQGNDGNFYGTTFFGGTNLDGTVFKISSNGALTSLYSFQVVPDGANPWAGLVQGSDGYLYGTTQTGGSNLYDYGTVFKISTNGVLTTLHSFTDGSGAIPDGATPYGRLVQGSDGFLYGTTEQGGTNNDGTVFKISTDGALTYLHEFTGPPDDGEDPDGGLVQGSDGNFYGTTSLGGTNYDGTVFKMSTNGALTILYSFTGINDGRGPGGELVQGSDGNFYGTTYEGGGTNDAGTLFQISTNGVLTNLWSFTGGVDGGNPYNGLVQGSDGKFYGTTDRGGTNDEGTVFQINTNRVLTSLYSFGAILNADNSPLDGGYPIGPLVQGSDGSFYGTTSLGGTNDDDEGTVFRLTIVVPAAPQLAIALWGANVILTWPTDATGFTLQSTTNLASPDWITVSGQFAVTNPISGWQMFFRLIQ
jgi:uncharacterized repeat protein (TIGR03803 family)